MAKKQQPNKPAPKRISTPAVKPAVSSSTVKSSKLSGAWLQYIIAMAITALCYIGSLDNELVNWDDDPNITENINLQRVGTKDVPWSQTISNIFSLDKGNVIGNYNPLPILTFAMEKAWKNDGFGEKFVRQVHVDNLILHLLVVLFAMRVLLLLGIGRWGALIGGLLMGIHPMRVESVAWATERKDVLFAFFFFASLECYIRYAKAEASGRKWLFFAASMVLAALSLYSKVQAVTLVVSMLVVDYYLQRRFSVAQILEKIPLFAASIAMGLANIYTLKVQGSTNDDITGFTLLDRACIATYSFSVYLYKLIIPYPMSPLYPYPKPLPALVYASPLLFLGVAAAVYWMWKNSRREWVFGVLFFFLNVAPVLQFLGAGQGFLADRFTYVPYFGLFFIAAYFYDKYTKDTGFGTIPTATAGVFLAAFAYLTVQQVKIWENGDTLWSHVMKLEKDPKSGKGTNSLPYWNRGQYLRKNGQAKKALEDYTTAISINPKNAELYNSRGKTYFDLCTTPGMPPPESADYLQRSVKDYDSAVELSAGKPKVQAEALINRGAAKGLSANYESALADLNKGIALDPTNKNGYFNRSIVYFNTNQHQKAIEDYSKYLEIDPFNANMWYERGMLRRTLKQYQLAIEDLSRCIALKPDFGLAYVERARANALMGNKPAAEADYRMAKSYGHKMEQMDMQVLGTPGN